MTTVQSAYIHAPFQVSFRQIALREPGPGEVRLEILACGLCGSDMEAAAYFAEQPQPFGHEVVGIVRQVGAQVTHVQPGEHVVVESSSYCGDCALCRNGRVELCAGGPHFWRETAMGFSDGMIVPGRAVVPAPDIDPLAAALAEPCGVALDMVKTAEIGLSDRVLVVGVGAIGLMALAIARRLTAGVVVAANRSTAKLVFAAQLGANHVFSTRTRTLTEMSTDFGGFDKILITAPPQVIPDAMSAAAYGGYLVFIGSVSAEGGVIPLDTHALHFGKKQLRASFASPGIYLPQVLHLLRTGVVPAEAIVSHRFPLSQMAEAIRVARDERETARKILVIPDEHFA